MNDWAQTEYEQGVDPTRFCLPSAFRFGTTVSYNPEILFFEKIWIPVKNFNKESVPLDITPEEFYALGYKWENIGLTLTDLADAYQTLYGFNLFDVPLLKDSQNSIRWSVETLGAKIKSIFNLNKGKYLKLLDLQDYTYNPLWNVDGTEIRQYLENQGINDVLSNSFASGHGGTAEDVTNTHKTASYDGTEKTEYTDQTQGGQVSLDGIPQYWYNSTTHQWEKTNGSLDHLSGETMSASGGRSETTYTHNNAMNKKWNATTQKYDEEEYEVDAEDTAFKKALVGGDRMHNEKLIRQGNIGVTRTQELIESERTNLRFSVLKEFFDDINEQLLVGIYRF